MSRIALPFFVFMAAQAAGLPASPDFATNQANLVSSSSSAGTNQETVPLHPTVSADAGEFRAAWCHSAFGIENWGWDKTVSALKSNGFNAVIPNMLWAGLAFYPSKFLPVSPTVAQRGDQIAECLKACRKYGVAMHVWKVNYNLSTAPKDFLAQLRAAGRTQKSQTGEDLDWLCPSNPENFALERDSMLEVVRNYDGGGLHFDYIRYPGSNACYCAGCKERFETESGLKIEKFPDDAVTGPYASRFNNWRRGQITRLVRSVSEEARRIKPPIKISAAVYGLWSGSRQTVGQDWKAWVEAGCLDFVCPMNYESDDGKFTELVRKQIGWVNHKIPLYAGIGAHKLSGPDQLARQIQLARNLGADGFAVFNLTEKLATEFLPQLHLQ